MNSKAVIKFNGHLLKSLVIIIDTERYSTIAELVESYIVPFLFGNRSRILPKLRGLYPRLRMLFRIAIATARQPDHNNKFLLGIANN